MINLSMVSKNLKNQNQPEIKNLLEFIYVFSQNLKVKKTPNMKSHHQMGPFDTNIDSCSGLI
jgi:hypothetical protein